MLFSIAFWGSLGGASAGTDGAQVGPGARFVGAEGESAERGESDHPDGGVHGVHLLQHGGYRRQGGERELGGVGGRFRHPWGGCVRGQCGHVGHACVYPSNPRGGCFIPVRPANRSESVPFGERGAGADAHPLVEGRQRPNRLLALGQGDGGDALGQTLAVRHGVLEMQARGVEGARHVAGGVPGDARRAEHAAFRRVEFGLGDAVLSPGADELFGEPHALLRQGGGEGAHDDGAGGARVGERGAGGNAVGKSAFFSDFLREDGAPQTGRGKGGVRGMV